MSDRRRYICATAIHAALLILECIAFYPCPFTGELIYYTQDSNLLELFASAVFLLDAARRLKQGKTEPSRWVRALSYAAACMLTVTLLVVIFILSFMKGTGGLKHLLFDGDLLYVHFLCPLGALIGFLFLEKTPPLTKTNLLIALLPTFLYAAVTILLNALRIMRGPYPFLYVHEQPLYMSFFWALAVIGGATLITWGLKKLNAAHRADT